jgi:hypothetical protein
MNSQKVLQAVIPAKAGVQYSWVFLDSGFRRNEVEERFQTSDKTTELTLGRLPSTCPCVILPSKVDGRSEEMNPIETAATLFDQGYT